MTYCTKSDMTSRFGEAELVQLTDANGIGVIDDAVLDLAIADATQQINDKLRGRYPLPVTPAPASLILVACDLARYYLHKDVAPELVTKRHDNAMRQLRDYANGTARLDVPNATDTAPAQPVVSAPGEVFSAAMLETMP